MTVAFQEVGAAYQKLTQEEESEDEYDDGGYYDHESSFDFFADIFARMAQECVKPRPRRSAAAAAPPPDTACNLPQLL